MVTVQEMFDQFMQSRNPEVEPDQHLYDFLKEAFYTGAKCIVVLGATAVSPKFPGDKPQFRAVASVLSEAEKETTAFIRDKYAREHVVEESRIIPVN